MSAATLAGRVKTAREKLGLAQSKLPGLDQGTVSKIESGKLRDPGLDVLNKLAAALGMTLDELNGAPVSAVRMVELRELQADPNNPRTMSDDVEDQTLMDSIRQLGLLQPLAVRQVEGAWRVVDGHRRYAALVQLHGPKAKVRVPVRIVEADDSTTLLMQLVANVQRADMNPMDLADAVTKLVEGGMDTHAIADAIGRKRRWVQEQASIGRHLTDSTKDALRHGIISISQAGALAAERDADTQNALRARAVIEKMTEDDIRAVIANTKAKAAAAEAKAEAEEPSPQLDIEDFAPGWSDDESNAPFGFGMIVYRITDMKARGWPS